MNKKLVAVVAAVLVLAGCTAAPGDDGADSARVAPSEAVEPTAAPLAEQPALSAEPEPGTDEAAQALGFADANDMFLRSLVGVWGDNPPSDAEQIAAGKYACEQIDAGVPQSEIIAVQGDSDAARQQNQSVIVYATYAWCPTEI